MKAASDLGESVNAVNKVFGSASEQVRAWGRENANAIGLSTRAFNQMATPLGSMLKNQGLALDQVTDHTIKLTERAADMASVFNTDVQSALIAIQAGLRGEQDPLERYGVSLSAVSVEARALADSHKTSASQLTAQEKALARLNLIYDQTADTAGDFRDTADGLANSQRIATATMEEAKAKIGGVFIPVMAHAAQVTGRLAETVTSLPQPVVLVVAAVAGLGAALALLAPRIIATREALEKMAASDSVVQRGMAKTAVVVGKATAALAALQIAGGLVSSMIDNDLNPQIEAAAGGLAEWDRRSKLAGEAARLFGDDAQELAAALQVLGQGGFYRVIDQVDQFASGILQAESNIAQAQKFVSAFDAALVQMVQRGQIEEAGRLVEEMAERTGISVERARELLPGYTGAVEVAGRETAQLAVESKNATKELERLGDEMSKHAKEAFSLEEAQDKAADAVERLKDQIKQQREEHEKGAGALTGNTQAARDNREAVRDLVGIYQDLVIKTAEAGKSTDGLDRQLEDTLVQMGFNRQEAHRYVKELGLIPNEITTQVRLEANPALRAVQETRRELYRMFGEIRVPVSVRDPMAGGHAHGGITGAENGGLRGGWTMTGERGRELVKLPYGSTVYPHGTTEAMLSGGGGGGGGGGAVAMLRVAESAGPLATLVRLLLPYISVEVQKAGGSGAILGVSRI